MPVLPAPLSGDLRVQEPLVAGRTGSVKRIFRDLGPERAEDNINTSYGTILYYPVRPGNLVSKEHLHLCIQGPWARTT